MLAQNFLTAGKTATVNYIEEHPTQGIIVWLLESKSFVSMQEIKLVD